LDGLGTWTRHLARAAIAQTEDEADALLAAGLDQPAAVVGPYLVDVELTPGDLPKPRHFREGFRELGPSNRTDLGRQADLSDAVLSGGGPW
ncbi:MAG: DUF2849 domain-containing protein, partial [Pseudomonadota bacterium]